jgi:hypothetical protein
MSLTVVRDIKEHLTDSYVFRWQFTYWGLKIQPRHQLPASNRNRSSSCERETSGEMHMTFQLRVFTQFKHFLHWSTKSKYNYAKQFNSRTGNTHGEDSPIRTTAKLPLILLFLLSKRLKVVITNVKVRWRRHIPWWQRHTTCPFSVRIPATENMCHLGF